MMTIAKIKAAAVLVALVGGTGAGGAIALHAAMAEGPSNPATPGNPAAEQQNDQRLRDLGQAVLKEQAPDSPQTAPAAIHTIADAPPVVVSTFPPAGVATVSADEPHITVTFSKPMLDHSWSWVMSSANTFPAKAGDPKYTLDHKTCLLPVKLEPNRTYVIWLNSPKFQNFMDTDRRPAVPYLLVFQTAK